MPTSAKAPQPAAQSRVGFEGLLVMAHIGTSAEERAQTQPLLVDTWIDLDLDLKSLAASDDLALSLDYASLADAVRQIVTQHEHQLIETVALKIAQRCRAHPLARRAEVLIRKPNALPGAACARFQLVL
jgi:dihydroneopterin aldolase